MAETETHPDGPSTPLCLHCLTQVSPLHHICPSCGHSVGQFTNYMPMEQIPFLAECVGGLWNRLWFGAERSTAYRLFCIVLIGVSVPWLFLASPLAIWQLVRARVQTAAG